MKKITELTDTQIAAMDRYIQEWTAIGLSTEPANRPEAEAAIRQMYLLSGLQPPSYIIWTTSPLAQGLTATILKDSSHASVWDSVWASVRASVGASVRDSVGTSVRDSVWASVWDSVWDSVRTSVRDSVWASVGASVRASVRDSVGTSVWDSVGTSVRDSVWASVWDSVWASVWDSVRTSVRDSVWASVGASVRDSVGTSVWDSAWGSVGASVRDSVGDSVYGQHDAAWLTFYQFFRQECGLTVETDCIQGLAALAKSAGWAIPYTNVCFVSERHSILRRNAQGQLHAEMGPSIEYPDGWQIFALNGVLVPEWMATSHPDDIDARKLLQVENVDQRREGIRRMGMERIVQQLEPKTLNACGDYELLAVEMNHGDPWRFLKMKNPSIGCIHIEAVPRECDTVQQAINWRRYQDVRTDWFPSQLT